MHKDLCLLYDSGEMSPQETAEFQAHLDACPGCREWLETAGKGHEWARGTLEYAPPELVEAVKGIARHETPPDGSGGPGTGGGWRGWLSFALITAAISGGGYAVMQLRGPAPVQVPAARPRVFESRADRGTAGPPSSGRMRSGGVPAPSPGTGRMDLVAGTGAAPGLPNEARSSPAVRMADAEDIEMPPRPLDCGSTGAILDFKRYAIHEWQAFPEDGKDLADKWSACLCGGAGVEAGQPAMPPRRNYARWHPACVGLSAGEDAVIKNAEFYYEYLPVSQAQAIRLVECECKTLEEILKLRTPR